MNVDDFLAHTNYTAATEDMVNDFLSHHGVKGMHWGSHMQRQLELHTRVANGTASRHDKYKALTQMSAIDLAKHRGNIQAFSQERAKKLKEVRDRADAGTSKKRERVAGALSYTGEDLARKVLNKPRTRQA